MSTFQIKVLAVILMVIDHVGFFLFPGEQIFRIIGRLSFPLFAFLITTGYVHTRDVKKYLLRLFIFANMIHIPSFFMSIPLNIFYTLSFGLLSIMIYESKQHWAVKILLGIALIGVVEFAGADYGLYGVLLIFVIYLFKSNIPYLFLSMSILSVSFYGFNGIQLFSVLAIPIMAIYNNEQGPKWKVFFYLFYPVHIVILQFISTTWR